MRGRFGFPHEAGMTMRISETIVEKHMRSLHLGKRNYMGLAGKVLAFVSYAAFGIGLFFLSTSWLPSYSGDVFDSFGFIVAQWGVAFLIVNILLRWLGFVEPSFISHLVESAPFYALGLAWLFLGTLNDDDAIIFFAFFLLPIVLNLAFHLPAIVREFREMRKLRA
jgi:hypothetical protein